MKKYICAFGIFLSLAFFAAPERAQAQTVNQALKCHTAYALLFLGARKFRNDRVFRGARKRRELAERYIRARLKRKARAAVVNNVKGVARQLKRRSPAARRAYFKRTFARCARYRFR